MKILNIILLLILSISLSVSFVVTFYIAQETEVFIGGLLAMICSAMGLILQIELNKSK